MSARLRIVTLVAFLFVIPLISNVYAGGIKVSPGSFCMQDAPIGEDVDLGIDLAITNDSQVDKTFTIEVLTPSKVRQVGVKGYFRIPNPDWFYFSQNELSIPAGKQAKTRMYLKIPDEEKHYNQHWMVVANVKAREGQGRIARLGIKSHYMIETTSKPAMNQSPFGALATMPSTVTIRGAVAGGVYRTSFILYNNSDRKKVYMISTHIPESTLESKNICPSRGFEWILSDAWVKPLKRKIALWPGTSREVPLLIRIPKNASLESEGWEAVVLIEPKSNDAGFVRVKIVPAQ